MKPSFNLREELEERGRRAKALLPIEHHDEFDALVAHAQDGHHGRTMLWRSLSPAQRRLLHAIPSGGAVVRIAHAGMRYKLAGSSELQSTTVGRSTVQKLVAHGLMHWVGTSDDPEGHASLTTKGLELITAMRERH